MQKIINFTLGVLVVSTSGISAHKATSAVRLTAQGSMIARALVQSQVQSPALAEIERKGAETYRNYVRTMHAKQGSYQGRALVPCGPQELLVINNPVAQRTLNPVLYVLATSPFLSMGGAAVTGDYIHRNYVAQARGDKKIAQDAPAWMKLQYADILEDAEKGITCARQKAYCAYEQERLAEQQEVLADVWASMSYVNRFATYLRLNTAMDASRGYASSTWNWLGSWFDVSPKFNFDAAVRNEARRA